MRHACGASCARDASARRDTAAIDASASPRKPSVAIASRSITLAIFDVACRATASARSSRPMPAAVVGDAQPLDAAAREIDVDLRRARVEAVLQQLLQRRRRTLDDFAGGDLVDQQIGQRDGSPSSSGLSAGAPSARRCRRRCRSASRHARRRRAGCPRATGAMASRSRAIRRRRSCTTSPPWSRVISTWHWKPIWQVVDDIRLVRIERVAENTRRTRRQVERIVVPLERGEAFASAEPVVTRVHVDRRRRPPSRFRR